jgi:hypothetical protein
MSKNICLTIATTDGWLSKLPLGSAWGNGSKRLTRYPMPKVYGSARRSRGFRGINADTPPAFIPRPLDGSKAEFSG